MTYDEFKKMVDEVFPQDEGFYQIIDCDDYIEDAPVEVYYHPRKEIRLETCQSYMWKDKPARVNPTREEMEKDKTNMKKEYREALLRLVDELQSSL